MASCLIQADALEVCCDAAGSNAEATYPTGIAVLWPRFGYRVLVPSPVDLCRYMEPLGKSSSHAKWRKKAATAVRLLTLVPESRYKTQAPQLRRLLHATESGGSAARAARELRRDLRTLTWLLYHAPWEQS
ncbi:hypothetical protein AK812_SmicGene9155 [Symbiodinium microadriaticum]|uniref:Uncharacterized protein n=1 Tax=Symbiodinium microadriaticum TaxID=2951 RepID=A0A1Q9EJ57_SYMMI|nr:hypothetical protein AK812_SmicGene9155 [Symbiodinium microadriaticum]